MRKRTSWILIAVVLLVVAAVAWGGRKAVWDWLLALHGRH